ncbi:MAG: polyamine aminopropyltransferase [SAR324 cluster bacterium]|uniref:Polyamine aminopropyltransferase n=1 Tax=SAR324 cluster bacterium TaxID=2024889 RepID=A0A7X9FT75_9DELT|nr:polyamine aminopropyltransferase [SAR324 cluster bacterium]
MELWLDEELELKEGRALKVRVNKVLESFQTKYQRLEIVETQSFGRMFLLDGVIMFTDRDEFCYHEMIAHVPMMSHPKPEKVLIVGGGDGGALREVLKHASVKEAIVCDIDEKVTEMSKEYFPQLACSFSDCRVRVFHSDGAKFIRDHSESFDVILVDSTDPVGPGAVLFAKDFYTSIKKALKPGGIAVTQAESFQYHKETISALYEFIPEVFREYGYYWISIPTYPSGIIGFTFLSDQVNPYSCSPDPKRLVSDLKYYSLEMHKASFVIPPFAKKFIKTSQIC